MRFPLNPIYFINFILIFCVIGWFDLVVHQLLLELNSYFNLFDIFLSIYHLFRSSSASAIFYAYSILCPPPWNAMLLYPHNSLLLHLPSITYSTCGISLPTLVCMTPTAINLLLILPCYLVIATIVAFTPYDLCFLPWFLIVLRQSPSFDGALCPFPSLNYWDHEACGRERRRLNRVS